MEDFLKKSESYVKTLFEKYTIPSLVYHNLSHTLRVVRHVREIEANYNLSSFELQTIEIAAWFHDVGHLFGAVKGHEQIGVEVMQEFLADSLIGNNTIDRISQCILVTEFPSDPINLIEQIICDADTYHLGTTEFKRYDILVKHEMQLRNMPINDWDIKTLSF